LEARGGKCSKKPHGWEYRGAVGKGGGATNRPETFWVGRQLDRVVRPLENVLVGEGLDAGLHDLAEPLLALLAQLDHQVEPVVELLPAVEGVAELRRFSPYSAFGVGGDDHVHVEVHDQVGQPLHRLVGRAVVAAEVLADLRSHLSSRSL
jgi:hypothetical protein